MNCTQVREMRACGRSSADGGEIRRVRGAADRNQYEQLREIRFQAEQQGEVDGVILRIHRDAIARRRHIGESVDDVAQQAGRNVGDLVVLRVDSRGGEIAHEPPTLDRTQIAHLQLLRLMQPRLCFPVEPSVEIGYRPGLNWAIRVTRVRMRREDRPPSRLNLSQTSAGNRL
jgi:hypothetical protein